MTKDYIYLQYMKERFNLKYNIFDDKGKDEKTSDTINKIILTQNNEFIKFCSIYFFLFEQRIICGSDEKHPITSKDIWPYINSSRSIILRYLKNNDDKEFKDMVEYLLLDFNPKLEIYLNELLEKHKLMKNKLSSEKNILLNSSYRKEILVAQDKMKFGLKLNEIAASMYQINVLNEQINEIEILIKDEKRYKFNFYLSLFLAVFSILLSVFMYFYPRM